MTRGTEVSTRDIDELNARVEKTNRRFRLWQLGITCLTALLILIPTWLSIEQRNRLIDCTTPGGDCYQEGQQRTGEAIEQLINANQDSNDRQTVELLRQFAQLLQEPSSGQG